MNQKRTLIAMVATAVMIGGQRTVIQPGGELPELTEHDENELLASKSASDPALIKNADEAAALTRAAAQTHFEKERQLVQAATASAKGDEQNAEGSQAGQVAAPAASKKAAETTHKPRK